jgi:hypothetical protein
MPTLYQSALGKGVLPAPIGSHSDMLSVRAVIIPTAALAANDVMEGPVLPAGHVPVDCILDSDDLDTNGAPTLTLDVGLMSGTPGVNDSARTVGNEFIAAATMGQTGIATISRMIKGNMLRYLPSDSDRSIGVKAAAGAATGVATLTNLNVNRGFWQAGVTYTANDYITLPNGIRMKCTTTGVSGATNPFKGTVVASYNVTTADGTAVWTTADPQIGVTLMYRPAYKGA